MADIGRMKTYNKAEYYAGQHRRMYVYGSAALQPEAVPKQIQKPKKQSVKASRQVRKNRKRAQSISPVYAVFLTGGRGCKSFGKYYGITRRTFKSDRRK